MRIIELMIKGISQLEFSRLGSPPSLCCFRSACKGSHEVDVEDDGEVHASNDSSLYCTVQCGTTTLMTEE